MANLFSTVKSARLLLLLLVIFCGVMLWIYSIHKSTALVPVNGVSSNLCANTQSGIMKLVMSVKEDKLFALFEDRVFVVSTSSDTVVADIPISLFDNSYVFSAGFRKGFFISRSEENRYTLNTLDFEKKMIAASIPITESIGEVDGAVSSRDNLKLYLLSRHQEEKRVLVLSINTGEILRSISVPKSSSQLVMPSDGAKIYVVGELISVINTASDSVESKISFEGNQKGMPKSTAINSDDSLLAIGFTGQPSIVRFIDLKNNASSFTVSLGIDSSTAQNQTGVIFPESISFNADKLYVVHHYAIPGRVSIIDINQRIPVGHFELADGFAAGISIASIDNKAYIFTAYEDSKIEVIDLDSNVIRKIPIKTEKEGGGCTYN